MSMDALVDILYVTYGAASVMGIDLDPFWDEVQKANAAKGDGPIDEYGKRRKPEGWTPPDIEGVLHRVLFEYPPTVERVDIEVVRRRNSKLLVHELCDYIEYLESKQ